MSVTADYSLTVLLRKLGSIGPLSPEERQAIERLPATVRVLEPRQEIVREGERPSHCFLVLDGWVCSYKIISQGRRQIFAFHVPGDLPDLQSLHVPVLDHSFCTLTHTTLAFVPHESLRELTARFPNIAALFWRATLIDAGIFREWMLGLGRRTASEHLAHMLCELYLKLQAVGLAQEHRYTFPVTQQDLGDATGLSNVHVNRMLQDLRRRG
ncbi:Crp/Fnr family transcriptional regulator [Methylobacterium nigriterrae]|uniref:Crp/Fnr family transcriptional regulator n=1 Tax=Methylobacterium nigriterrae TaxID=3127512 RepID=UPI003013D3EF